MNKSATKIDKEQELLQVLAGKFARKATPLVHQRSGNISVSYNRVSSKDQMDNGNSLTWQNEQIAIFAKRKNLQIAKQYGGTYESAKTDDRKEFQRMLKDIRKDTAIAYVLVYSYDRFSRSGTSGIVVRESLRKLGIQVISITQEVDASTATGAFQENVLMLVSKLDNDMRKGKSLEGTKSMLQRGYWPHGTPMGYDNLNKFSTADKHQYAINTKGLLLRQAFKWKAEGKYSNETIRKKLGIDKEKYPYSIELFGNTSSASIPLTLCFGLKDKLLKESLNLLLCGFGVGLSWGTAILKTENLKCAEIIEL